MSVPQKVPLPKEKKKKLSVCTSPGRHVEERSSSPITPSFTFFDLEWDDKKNKSVSNASKKRGRSEEKEDPRSSDSQNTTEENKPQKQMRAKFLRLVAELVGTTNKLRAEATGVTTKKTIKDLVSSLSSIVSQINTDGMKEVIEGPKIEPPVRIATSEMGTQTTRPGWNLKKTLKEEDLNEVKSLEEFQNLEKQNWPEDIYKNTALVVGNPLLLSSEWDTIAWQLEADEKMERRLPKMFRERYPELLDLNEEVDFITVQTKSRNTLNTEKYILKAKLSKDTPMFDTVMKIKELLVDEGRKQIAIPIPEGMAEVTFRKMVQTIFNNTEIKANVHLPYNNSVVQNEQAKKHKRDNNPAIIVRTNGANYADKLKELKEKIGDEEASDSIRAVRKTKEGDILLTLGTKDGAENLTKALKEKGLQCKKGGKTGRTTVNILNIDPTIEKEEVVGKLKSLNLGNFEVAYTRENSRTGNYLLAIEVDKEDARKFLQTGSIKVGFATCKIKERVEVKKCYKCWAYGHTASVCKGINRENCCFKCGKAGHRAQECKEEEECVICKVKGHHTGSFMCKAYRQAFRKQRKNSTLAGLPSAARRDSSIGLNEDDVLI